MPLGEKTDVKLCLSLFARIRKCLEPRLLLCLLSDAYTRRAALGIANCSLLKSLTLKFSSVADNQTIMGVAVGCPLLESLSLAPVCLPYSRRITDNGLSYVAQYSRNLKKLDIGCCTKLTDKTAEAFASYGRLETFSARFTSISNSGVAGLVRMSDKLSSVDLFGCKTLTINLIPALVDAVRDREGQRCCTIGIGGTAKSTWSLSILFVKSI